MQAIENTANNKNPERSDLLDNEFGQKIEDIASALLLIAALSGSGNFEGVAQAKQQLLMMAQSDDRLLGELVQSFKDLEINDDNPQVKQALMQVLASIKDPQVENLAQDLAISDNRSKQLDGLELLSQLNIASEQSLDIAMTALSQSPGDPELLQSAMQAIPKMTISAEKNAEVINQLTELSKHENESVRSASLFLIAQQAKNNEQLSPLYNALNSKTVDEKISAIMAIEQSLVVSPELKGILLKRVADKSELAESEGNGRELSKSF